MFKRIVTLLMKLAVNALALLAVDSLFDRIWFDNPRATLFAAVALALVNTYVRPLVVALTLPFNILTLGLLTLVINAAMLKFVSWLIPTFHVEGFWTAVGGALVLSIVSALLNWFLAPERNRLHVHIHHA
jgi:putative membrane protein